MEIEPETKIVQGDFSGQARLKASQDMRTLTRQAKGIQEFVVNSLDDLSDAGQPPAQGFGPAHSLATLMRWSHQLDAMLLPPLAARSFSSKAFIGHIGSLSGQASTGQTRRWVCSGGKQGGRQVLIMGAGRAKAKAGNDSGGRDRQQQMKAFIPAEAIAPANIGLSSQPTSAAAFGVASHGRSTIQHFIAALLGMQQGDQRQPEGRDRVSMLAQEPIELATMGQLRKGGAQVLLRVAVESPFAGKLHPLTKECQGDHLASTQRRDRSRFAWLPRERSLAKIIHHDVQCCQEGIQIDHQRAPFLTNWFEKLTVRPGYRSFQVLSSSHQTFKFTSNVELPIYLCDSIMTTAKYGELFIGGGELDKVRKLKTSAGEFIIPVEIATNPEQIGRYAETLEECIKNKYATHEFINRCVEEGLPVNELPVHRQLYEQLSILDTNNQNGIWARIIKNAFAPLFIKRVDYVVGNPPWINWESLPEDYRDDMKPLWQQYGLFTLSGSAGRLGGGKKDISMLFVYSCIDNYLVDSGKLGFVITQTIFKTQGAGDGFRRFQFSKYDQNNKPLTYIIKPLTVSDLST